MEVDYFKSWQEDTVPLRATLAIDYSKILLERTVFNFDNNTYVLIPPTTFAEIAVERADALIAELKKEPKNDQTKK